MQRNRLLTKLDCIVNYFGDKKTGLHGEYKEWASTGSPHPEKAMQKVVMGLSKLEIQQMLREMNVKFEAEESYVSLKNRLQQENHSLWLKSVSARMSADGKKERTVVRKRKRIDPLKEAVDGGQSEASEPIEPASRPTERSSTVNGKTSRRQPRIEKPMAGKPWKDVANGTEPFNRKKKVFETVLRRAGNSCERCGSKPGVGNTDDSLAPYHIVPLEQGGEHSSKNVVALCPDCLKATVDDPDPKTIKALKRRTRAKLYDSVKVERRATRRSRRRSLRDRR